MTYVCASPSEQYPIYNFLGTKKEIHIHDRCKKEQFPIHVSAQNTNAYFIIFLVRHSQLLLFLKTQRFKIIIFDVIEMQAMELYKLTSARTMIRRTKSTFFGVIYHYTKCGI